MSSVKQIVEKESIVVFSSSTCPYCTQAIAALKAAGYEPSVVNASSYRNELYELTNRTSVPSIWVKGTYVGGCNDGPQEWMGITKMIKNGKLAEMMK